MDDTITALATPLSNGAISIIRVSGKDAINIVSKIFDKDLTNKNSHTITYGHIVNNNEIIDEVLVMLFRAPKTYTREDVVEINCHGGVYTTKKTLELLLNNGCRMAEKGEFTKRAFLNGRINLLEAEAVEDLVSATSDASRAMAINNVDGNLTKKIENIREKIVKILANIEVNIDYPEYTDELEVTNNLMKKYTDEIAPVLDDLVKNSKNGRMIKNGVNVALIGLPNVGKSSILNHLLDEEKAIVTDIPGTTRDIVEGRISLNGVAINFIDTAGIRVSNDVVEKIGIDKSKKTADNADIVILVLNNDKNISNEEKELLEKYNKDNLIIFVNKTDLNKVISIPDNLLSKTVYGNTISLDGLNDLKSKISEVLELDEIVNNDMSYLSNLRQIDLVTKAKEALDSAKTSLNDGMSVDIIEIDLRESWELLGELIGESYQDELVDNIFKNFCLGK